MKRRRLRTLIAAVLLVSALTSSALHAITPATVRSFDHFRRLIAESESRAQQATQNSSLQLPRSAGNLPAPLSEAIPGVNPPEPTPSANDVIGNFLTSGDAQARLDALQSTWTPEPYEPLSDGQPSDPLLAGMFAGFDATEAGGDRTAPTFPIVQSDPDIGLTITVDGDLGVTIVDGDGDVVRDFKLYLNLVGEPAAEYLLPDGSIERVSLEGYGLTISPDRQAWTVRAEGETYVAQMTEAGELVYADDAGDSYTLRLYDGDILTLDLPDGNTAAYVPGDRLDDATDGSLLVLDDAGNVLESGDFDVVLAELDDNPVADTNPDDGGQTGGETVSGGDTSGGDTGGDVGGGESGGDVGGGDTGGDAEGGG